MSLLYQYATALPEKLSVPLEPAPFPAPQIIALNEPLAQELGLDPAWLRSPAGLAFLSIGQHPDGLPPVATAYAGHQFGQFVPSLGDGRAMLAGELTDRHGQVFDLHLKGSGPTPFSRGGDGKCTLGPALREYLLSEAMHALGIPTTRALAVLSTGETILRDTPQSGPVPGAVIARVARSVIRVGTFQYAAAQGDLDSVQALADFTIARLYPEAVQAPHPYRVLLERVIDRQASLVAQWLGVGFIHGVMNTDNCALSGETLDYGPCAFLDLYEPLKVFSAIDRNGRYAYGHQPRMALWNLTRLAECLLPLLGKTEDEGIRQAEEALGTFDRLFSHYWLETFRKKLGLANPQENDIQLLEHLLETMHTGEADFTQTFRALSSREAVFDMDYRQVRELFPKNKGHADLCRTDMMARLLAETRAPKDRQADMLATNPRIIPRNHQIERVIVQAIKGDYALFHALHEALKTPYDTTDSPFDPPPAAEERVPNTFCGT